MSLKLTEIKKKNFKSCSPKAFVKQWVSMSIEKKNTFGIEEVTKYEQTLLTHFWRRTDLSGLDCIVFCDVIYRRVKNQRH